MVMSPSPSVSSDPSRSWALKIKIPMLNFLCCYYININKDRSINLNMLYHFNCKFEKGISPYVSNFNFNLSKINWRERAIIYYSDDFSRKVEATLRQNIPKRPFAGKENFYRFGVRNSSLQIIKQTSSYFIIMRGLLTW